MANEKNNQRNPSSEENVQTCETCEGFIGFNPSSGDMAPFAWCSPSGSNWTRGCFPTEDASKKTCYRPKNNST